MQERSAGWTSQTAGSLVHGCFSRAEEPWAGEGEVGRGGGGGCLAECAPGHALDGPEAAGQEARKEELGGAAPLQPGPAR